MINQPMDAKKQVYYNTSATQTILVEDHDEIIIADDMEIIPNNILQDDFVQLDINECNEEQSKVSNSFVFFSQ